MHNFTDMIWEQYVWRTNTESEISYLLLFDDGEHNRLCNDKAVWVHLSVFPTDFR